MESEKRETLKVLVNELCNSESLTEDRDAELGDMISQLSPDPEWSDYIFYSDEFIEKNGKLDVEKFLDKIFSYKPIQL